MKKKYIIIISGYAVVEAESAREAEDAYYSGNTLVEEYSIAETEEEWD